MHTLIRAKNLNMNKIKQDWARASAHTGGFEHVVVARLVGRGEERVKLVGVVRHQPSEWKR